MTSSPCIV